MTEECELEVRKGEPRSTSEALAEVTSDKYTDSQYAAAAYMAYRRRYDTMITLRQGCIKGLVDVNKRIFLYRQIRQSCLQRIPIYSASGTDRFLSHQVDSNPPLLSEEDLATLKFLLQEGFKTCRIPDVSRSVLIDHINQLRNLLSTLFLMQKMMERIDQVLTRKGEILASMKVLDRKALHKSNCYNIPMEETY